MRTETAYIGIEIAKKYRQLPRNLIFKLFPKKKKSSIIYFLHTGRDTCKIYKKLLSVNFPEVKGRSNMYNQTIEVSDWELAEIARRLELRYGTWRFFSALHRELLSKGYPFKYDMILRLFNAYRDTSGGRLLNAIKLIANEN